METYRIRFLEGPTLVRSIELVREFMGVGLREAKELVETHGVILDRATAAEARRVAARFVEIGAHVMVERTWRHVYAYDPHHPARGDQTLRRLRAGEREINLDSGSIGAWELPDLQELAADHRSDLDPAAVDRATLDTIAAWEREGLVVAESEIDVLTAVSAREPRLEARLRARPDDVEAHLIYGDWLQAAGDPRGQLIALQCARAQARSHDERTRLRARERELCREHAGHFFGPLRVIANPIHDPESHRTLALRWSLGFIDDAFIGPIGWSRGAGGPYEILATLLRLPVAARLQSLGLTASLLRRPELEGLLCGAEVIAELRSLELGDHVEPPRAGIGAPRPWSRLWPHMRRLQRLRLHGDEPPLRSLHSPTLEHLELAIGNIPRLTYHLATASERFVAGRTPRLRRLSLTFTDAAGLTPAAFADLIALPDFDEIEALELVLAEQTLATELVEVFAAVPRLASLASLDLSRCVVDRRGLAALEEARGRGRLPEDLRLPGCAG